MSFREFILSRVQVFFVLVTLILTAGLILGCLVAPDQELRYCHLSSPLLTAALCVLPTCVTYSKKEPSLRGYLLRQGLELLLIEGIVLFMLSPPADGSMPPAVFYPVLAAVVLAVYVLTRLILWGAKVQQSKKLTQQLRRLQARE